MTDTEKNPLIPYDVVDLDGRWIRGIKERTGNLDPQMTAVIGGLWQRFFKKGYPFSMAERTGDTITALYSDYQSDETGSYDITVGCQVEGVAPAPDKLELEEVEKYIPGGAYARFVLERAGQEQVAALWKQIWSMDLERTFTGDFEEYFFNRDGQPGEVHVHIAIK